MGGAVAWRTYRDPNIFSARVLIGGGKKKHMVDLNFIKSQLPMFFSTQVAKKSFQYTM
jgi:hypothetical protein